MPTCFYQGRKTVRMASPISSEILWILFLTYCSICVSFLHSYMYLFLPSLVCVDCPSKLMLVHTWTSSPSELTSHRTGAIKYVATFGCHNIQVITPLKGTCIIIAHSCVCTCKLCVYMSICTPPLGIPPPPPLPIKLGHIYCTDQVPRQLRADLW